MSKTKQGAKQYALRFDSEKFSELKEAAENEGVSVNQLIVACIDFYLSDITRFDVVVSGVRLVSKSN